MEHLKFDYEPALEYCKEESINYYLKQARKAEEILSEGSGVGGDFTGWLRLPENFNREEFKRVKVAASKIREIADAVIVIGIGGSYLGARSAMEALGKNIADKKEDVKERGYPEIFYAGNNISPAYLNKLIRLVEDKDIVLNVVSKSGTTLEPAIAFRVLRDVMEKKYGAAELKERIICTTDKDKGLLKKIADEEHYETFIIPDDIGGRYSVLTPVGLLPMAIGGIDIDAVMEGAASAMQNLMGAAPVYNPAALYASIRNLFYDTGKTIEVMASYEPSFEYIAQWWQQLFGESEGKEGKGIYPATHIFSTDLHSMGQYLQEGRRDIFLTTLWEIEPQRDISIPESSFDDGLDYLQGKSMHFINEQACKGTIKAHSQGGVPNLLISVPQMSPYYYGELVYFFQKACALSGYILGVNPFDQPGVEAYKKNMYSLLGK